MNLLPLKKIVCFGEVLWDMLPAGPQPGGAPMNAAIHLKRQGLDPILVSSVGNDTEGAALKDFLTAEQLNLKFLQETDVLPTSKVIVSLDADKNARYEIVEPVAWDNIQYSDELERLAGDAGLILFGTLASRNATTRDTLLRMLEQTPAVKLLDVNLRPPYDDRELVEAFLHRADFVKLNDDELHRVAGWNGKSGTDEMLMRWLSDHYNCADVCVTRGARGAFLLKDSRISGHKGFPVVAADTVGAGDAFLAALIASLAKGGTPESALTHASATGAFVASKEGAVPLYTPGEINEVFKLLPAQGND